MGACCCKTEPDEIGETGRLLHSPISEDPYGYRTSRAGTWERPPGANGVFGSYGDREGVSAQQADLNAAVAHILDSVAIQVIDVAAVGEASSRPLEPAELAKRTRELLKAAKEQLAQSPAASAGEVRRPLPGSGGGGLQLLINDSERTGDDSAARHTPRPADLQLATDTAAGVARAVADVGVSPPEDLLAAMGAK